MRNPYLDTKEWFNFFLIICLICEKIGFTSRVGPRYSPIQVALNENKYTDERRFVLMRKMVMMMILKLVMMIMMIIT